jgi:hypothetical protein
MHCRRNDAEKKTPRFQLGTIAATPGAIACLEACKTGPERLLRRHVIGDWGELCQEDVKENERSVAHGLRLLSSYSMPNGQQIWVITEADRSVTTLLLPEEY